jgi:excisionase family DNA binding protein
MAGQAGGEMTAADKQLMTTQEVADHLKVSIQTVRRWIRDQNPEKRLPAIRVGPRMYRVSRAELERWLSRRSTV